MATAGNSMKLASYLHEIALYLVEIAAYLHEIGNLRIAHRDRAHFFIN